MKVLLILINFFLLPVQAGYQEQELQKWIASPSARNDEMEITSSFTIPRNDEKDVRKLPPSRKKYPILDEFEKQLYPGRNFHKDKPDERLERVEIAVFGSKQNGPIKSRITALEMELDSWQIAQGKVAKLKANQHPSPVIEPAPQVTYQSPPPIFMPSPAPIPITATHSSKPYKKQIDYDYMNYRLIAPIIQSTARRGIMTMFNRDKN